MSSVAIDLGHHQALAARTLPGGPSGDFDSGHELIDLGATTTGLVVRWCEDDRPTERLHDRLRRLVDSGDLRSAAATAAAIAECLADLVPAESDDVRVAVPVGASLGHRAHLRAAFRQVGLAVDEHQMVPRPYAVLAHWLSIGGHRRLEATQGKTLVIDNDGGRSSALVVDIAGRQILAEGQITPDHTVGPEAATAALRTLLEAAYGAADPDDPVPWSVLSASVAEIVVAGSGAAHPVLARFLDERFPASIRHAAPERPEEIVVRGLLELSLLTGYRASWPTLALQFDDQTVRPAGSWRPEDASPTVAPVGTRLRFGDAPVVTSEGVGPLPARGRDETILADGELRIPDEVGPFPLLTIHPLGSIELRGTDASLRLHLDWPVAGTAARVLHVVIERILDLTIDRGSITPRGGPSRRATDES